MSRYDDDPTSPARRRFELVLRILKGEISVPAAACESGIGVAEIERLRELFLLGAEHALRSVDGVVDEDARVERLERKATQVFFDLSRSEGGILRGGNRAQD